MLFYEPENNINRVETAIFLYFYVKNIDYLSTYKIMPCKSLISRAFHLVFKPSYRGQVKSRLQDLVLLQDRKSVV